MKRIMDEERAVTALFGVGEEGVAFRTKEYRGRGPAFANCERIVPYWESGQRDRVVWFVVYGKDDVVLARVNAAAMEQVRYD